MTIYKGNLSLNKFTYIFRPYFFRPPHLGMDFILPDTPLIDEKYNVLPEHRVRIAQSFDMGWTTRGTGRSYDSLSGHASIIGYLTKQVISFITLNRKCRLCDKGHSQTDHDCRRNYAGSAKGDSCCFTTCC